MVDRGYPQTLIEHLLSDIKVHREGVCTPKTQQRRGKRNIASDTVPTLSVYLLKEVLMKKWNLIQNQPLLRQIFKEPSIISYKKGKSLRDGPLENLWGGGGGGRSTKRRE